MSPLKVFLVERNRARVAMTHLPRRRLLLSPLWTAGRHLALTVASLQRRGPVADASPTDVLTLPAMVLLGHVAAVVDIPGCLARRRALARKIEEVGGLSDARWQERLDRDRVGLRELVQSAPRA
jgi:hypothetical protein